MKQNYGEIAPRICIRHIKLISICLNVHFVISEQYMQVIDKEICQCGLFASDKKNNWFLFSSFQSKYIDIYKFIDSSKVIFVHHVQHHLNNLVNCDNMLPPIILTTKMDRLVGIRKKCAQFVQMNLPHRKPFQNILRRSIIESNHSYVMYAIINRHESQHGRSICASTPAKNQCLVKFVHFVRLIQVF